MRSLAYEVGVSAKKAGRNIAAELRRALGEDTNTPEIIEVAYDLQAGSYVDLAEAHPNFIREYAAQLARLIGFRLKPGDTLLDAGAGELTTLSHVVAKLPETPARILACDISERRLEAGRAYAERHMRPGFDRLGAFRAELSAIPLADNSVDLVTTNHAIEPNGGREGQILAELLRVSRRGLVLFEPCYEIATPEGRSRMESHGYIRDLDGAARRLGASVTCVEPLKLVANPLNPTACYVIRPGAAA